MLHVTFDVFDWDSNSLRLWIDFFLRVAALLRLLYDLFQIFVAIFKNEILSSFSIFTRRVVNVEHLDHIGAVPELIEHLILSAHVFACFLRPLDSHRLLAVLVIRLKNVSCINKNY